MCGNCYCCVEKKQSLSLIKAAETKYLFKTSSMELVNVILDYTLQEVDFKVCQQGVFVEVPP